MTTVYLAIGSNVGDSRAHIEQAIDLLAGKLHDLRSAPLYASKAIGYTDQADFLNTAVCGRTDLSPTDLLVWLKSLEQRVGRTASFRWGPREIDIDIIFYGDQVIDNERLTVPHPAFRERDFVLQPLSDLNPSLTDPVTGQTVSELLDGLEPERRSLVGRVD